MGTVHFRRPGPAEIPYKAKTGDEVVFKVHVINDNMPLVPGIIPDCVKCRLRIIIAADEKGEKILDVGDFMFSACCLYWKGEETIVQGSFEMPAIDIYIAFELYQSIEEQWKLVDSTIFLKVDNPDWPPSIINFFTWKILGLEFYKWMIICLCVGLAGVVIASRGSST